MGHGISILPVGSKLLQVDDTKVFSAVNWKWNTMIYTRLSSSMQVLYIYKLKNPKAIALGRELTTNLDSTLIKRGITLPTKVHIDKAMVFPVVMYGFENWTIKKTEHSELMLSNCVAGKDSWGSLGQQGDQTGQSKRKSTLNIHCKDWYWSWCSSTLATWCKEPVPQKRPLWWKRLRAGGEGDNRGRNGWMGSLTQQTWASANSGRWWRTGRSGMLQPTGSLTNRFSWPTKQ